MSKQPGKTALQLAFSRIFVKKGTSIEPPSLSVKDIEEFSIYLAEDSGVSNFTPQSHINGARAFLDWAGKLPKRSQYFKLDPRVRRRMKNRLSRLSRQENPEEVRKLETLLYLAEARTLHEISWAWGPARRTIRKWILEIAEAEPELVEHNVGRSSLMSSLAIPYCQIARFSLTASS